MNHIVGMSPEQVRAKATALVAQLSILEHAANTVHAAALASLNPLSYGIQPGGFVIAPFAITGTQVAANQVRLAQNSVRTLTHRLLVEAEQQEITSRDDGSSPAVPGRRRPSRPRQLQPRSSGNGWFGWLQGLTPASLFEASREFVEAKIGPAPWSLDDIGQMIPGLSNVLEVRAYADRFAHGQFPFHEIIGTIAGELRTKGNPLLYGAGVAIGVWDTAAQEAEKTDWSAETFNSNMQFISAKPAEAFDAAADAVVAFVPDLINNFKFW